MVIWSPQPTLAGYLLDDHLHKTIYTLTFSIALITPVEASFDVFPDHPILSHSKLPDGRYIYNLKYERIIFPGGWDSLSVGFWLKESSHGSREITLRSFTELGPRDYKLTLRSKP
jgi:hypothetical protein